MRLILGDQLNLEHSWFKEIDKNTVYLMAEMKQETDYVKHHIQKVVAFFLSMRNFSKSLESLGHKVHYLTIDDLTNSNNLEKIITTCIAEFEIEKFEYLMPDEYRLDIQLKNSVATLEIPFEVFDTEHFYSSRTELKEFFKGKKTFLMETFYRNMRKKHHLLMSGSQPEGGLWNFDHDNRKKYKGEVPIPKEKNFNRDVSEITEQIKNSGVITFGTINARNFNWPTSRTECLELVDYFCKHLLKHFGDYEDTMHTDEKFLFHSRLSFAMNTKMLSPKEVIETVIDYYNSNKEDISISQVEGFVRQILGWREYIRGIYWKEMPDYAKMNALGNLNKLPNFFWTGDTKMNCMKLAIGQSLDEAYAHHIQRLMVIGNFALLTQTHPDEVDNWYLGVYIDAIEWVQMPNTRGMSQYADGGIIATKPYVSSGSYINKMSNNCVKCHYNVKEKLGDNACPFNTLYWNFLDDKKEYFKGNHRMAMMMSLLKKMKPEDLANIKERSYELMKNINSI